MAHSIWIPSRQRSNDIQYPTVVSDMACGVRSALDPYSGKAKASLVLVGTAWNCTLCPVCLSNIKGTIFQTSFDGTVGDHMSIVVNRVQRGIVCFSSVPKPCSAMPVVTYCGRRSVADKWKLHWTTICTVFSSFCALLWTLPDTESRSVASHKAHSLVPLTPPFMDQKVVLRVLSLTRTLYVDALFGDRAHRPLRIASFSPGRLVSSLASGKRLAERRSENHNRASLSFTCKTYCPRSSAD